MCGIFLYSGDNHDVATVTNEFFKSQSRGPDNSHIITEGNVFVGFHRLMINDLSYNGDQPMCAGRSMMACNGEIYNHNRLRELYGLSCTSHSDCEVIVHLYNKFKMEEHTIHDAVNALCRALDGEFAFVIYDKELQIIIAARDPYGVRPLFIGNTSTSIGFASELKSLDVLFPNNQVKQFKPSSFGIFSVCGDHSAPRFTEYNSISEPYDIVNDDEMVILDQIKITLENAVEKRMAADVPICALLSGGLDSSLVCAILSKLLADKGDTQVLNTFSIGMEGSTDLAFARIVANHIKSNHHEVLVTEELMLSVIEEVVRVTETYDITTVRASTPNFLVSRFINASTPYKVVFTGEGSDEVAPSYKYLKNAPNPDAVHDESNSLLENIHLYDCLRADKSISSNGLEARVPFLDPEFVKCIQSINPVLRTSDDRIEKYLLRKAFDGTGLLPKEVLMRSKDAFSDGVSATSNSWHTIIHDFVDKLISDDEFLTEAPKYTHCTPHTKEAYWYRRTFHENYSNDEVIPGYWMPKWSGNITDPSAREL